MKNFSVILSCVIVAVACLLGAGALSSPINQDRRDLNLMMSDDLSDLPKDTQVLQAATGVFRGFALNVIWQRAEGLKEEGKYHEAVQLGEWITRLQPKFAQVWEFVSWNQSYNISVGTHTPQERWAWVKSGIDLLQSKGNGIDANPNALRLYHQLSYIYLHKIGMFLDSYNWYYKRQIAAKWHNVLGQPPEDIDRYIAWLQPVVDAPNNVIALSEDARRLAEWTQSEGYAFDEQMLFVFTARVGGPSEDEDVLPDIVVDATLGEDDNAVDEGTFGDTSRQFPDWASAAARDELLAFVRRKVITGEELNMQPERMLADAKELGPLDWRHPLVHSIYWARRGIEQRQTDDDRSHEGLTNVRRMIMSGLEAMAKQGKVVFDPATGAVTYLPRYEYWDKLDQYYTELKNSPGVDAERFETAYGPGFRNRMDGAIAQAELLGNVEVARNLYANMRVRYEGTRYAEHYQQDFDKFLELQFLDTVENPDSMRSMIMQLLTHSNVTRYVNNDVERADELIAKATDLHRQWRDANPDPGDPQYYEVPDFNVMIANGRGNFFLGNPGQLSTTEIPVQIQAGVWRQMSEQGREYIFPLFAERMYARVAELGYAPVAVFPPPQRFANVVMASNADEYLRMRAEEEGTEEELAERQRK